MNERERQREKRREIFDKRERDRRERERERDLITGPEGIYSALVVYLCIVHSNSSVFFTILCPVHTRLVLRRCT